MKSFAATRARPGGRWPSCARASTTPSPSSTSTSRRAFMVGDAPTIADISLSRLPVLSGGRKRLRARRALPPPRRVARAPARGYGLGRPVRSAAGRAHRAAPVNAMTNPAADLPWPTSTGPSSSRATARSRPSSMPGPRRRSCPPTATTAPPSTTPAAALVRSLGEGGWLSHAIAGRQFGRQRRRHRHALDLPRRARPSRGTPAWPTSPSRCRGSARARSASPARAEQPRRLAAEGRPRQGDRGVRAVGARGRLRRRGDGAALGPASTATTTCSTAKKTCISKNG